MVGSGRAIEGSVASAAVRCSVCCIAVALERAGAAGGLRGLRRLLGAADELFAAQAAADIRRYATDTLPNSVLVFPPVSNYRRFLIHKTAEDFKDEGLATFSIGQGDDRRTVVCYGHQIIGGVGVKDDKMVVESQNVESSSNDKKGGEASKVYRPPQIRMQNTQRPHRDNPIRVRRPDRAVYVPLARRSVPVSPSANEDSPTVTTPENESPIKDEIPEKVPESPKIKRTLDKTYCNVYKPPQARSKSNSRPSDINLKSIQPDESCESSVKVPHNVNDIVPNSDSVDEHVVDNASESLVCDNTSENVIDSAPATVADIEHTDHVAVDTPEYVTIADCYDSNMDDIAVLPTILRSDVIIDDDIHNSWNEKKDEDKDQKEFIKASENINRSNRRIIKQSFVSDVLIISDNNETPTKCNVEEQTDNKQQTNVRLVPFNPNEEENWEDMVDDNCEWLGPQLVEELTAAVGRVTVQKPHTDYKKHQNSFSHVLEVYNFPATFTTNDLVSVFAEFKHTGFEIKWVDDNHALAVFSSSEIAAEVMACKFSLLKTRPLAEATHESRNKAKKSAEFLQPYRPRPQTCAALAKRLVKGALGVKLDTDAQERLQERQQLSIAREKKRLAAQHREAAWNGSLTSNTTQ